MRLRLAVDNSIFGLQEQRGSSLQVQLHKLDAEIFLRKVLEYCEGKPTFLVDKGPWYHDALERLEYGHETR